MTTAPLDREAILRAIESWPQAEQLALARTILERANPSPGMPGASACSTWDALYGIASSGGEPPSEEEVVRWLDEHKMEKYGH